MQQRIGGGKFSGLTCLLRFSALCVKFYGFSLRLGSRLYKFSGFSTLCKTEPPFVQPCVYSVSQSRSVLIKQLVNLEIKLLVTGPGCQRTIFWQSGERRWRSCSQSQLGIQGTNLAAFPKNYLSILCSANFLVT